MQELYDYVQDNIDYGILEDIVLEKARELLEKEKEQIIDAFNEGIDEMAFATSGINYYNQTYNQNK